MIVNIFKPPYGALAIMIWTQSVEAAVADAAIALTCLLKDVLHVHATIHVGRIRNDQATQSIQFDIHIEYCMVGCFRVIVADVG